MSSSVFQNFGHSGRSGDAASGRFQDSGRTSIQLEGSAKETLEQGRNRLVIAGVLFAFCFMVLSGRLIGLALSGLGESSRVTAERVTPKTTLISRIGRAPIYDRAGNLLAVTLDTVSLYADPSKVIDPREAARKIVTVLTDLNVAAVEEKMSSRRNFVWLKRHLTPMQQKEINNLGVPGVLFRDEKKRVYPMGPLAAHLVGYTDIDNNGIAGAEKYFDDRLAGVDQEEAKPVYLSVDMRVQYALRDELSRYMSIFKAIGAAGVVMDIQTSEILGMVSLPDFDPNRPGDFPGRTKFNNVSLGVYEMGSTFKTFTVAMALDSKTVSLSDGYDATKPIRIAGARISDYHGKKRWLSIPEIYMYSSNIGSAKMAEEVGAKRQRAFLDKIGLLRKPVVELPEVGAPILPTRWNTLETMTISYGHGLSVSPLQVSAAVSAIVNGGIYRNPTILRKDKSDIEPGRRVIRAKTSEIVRRMMRLVVEKGTGRKAAAKGYVVGGKTGTADKAVNGSYDGEALVTSFISAFPMNNPRYMVLALLDEPKGNASSFGFRTAGWTTAPIVSRLVSRIAPILGVKPVDEESEEIRKIMEIPLYSREKKLATF